VVNEDLLVSRLKKLLGKRLKVFSGLSSTSTQTALGAHIELFQSADVIIGPHGAGLTNMVYARPGTSVVEFVMEPHCNRCFGYVAAALDLDYWALPQVSTFYHLKYEMTKDKAATVEAFLRNLLERRGLLPGTPSTHSEL